MSKNVLRAMKYLSQGIGMILQNQENLAEATGTTVAYGLDDYANIHDEILQMFEDEPDTLLLPEQAQCSTCMKSLPNNEDYCVDCKIRNPKVTTTLYEAVPF